MIRFICNLLVFLLPPTRFFKFKRSLLKISKVSLGQSVYYCGRSVIYGRGQLLIGDNTWISPGAVIHTNIGAPIIIGKNCDIGPGVEFLTGSHIIGPPNRRAGFGISSEIRVGNGTWIGAGCKILGGVSIGNGSVIAAGSVVTKSFPNNVLLAGVPATIKRFL